MGTPRRIYGCILSTLVLSILSTVFIIVPIPYRLPCSIQNHLLTMSRSPISVSSNMEAEKEVRDGPRAPSPSPASSISKESIEFKPTTRLYLAFGALAVLTLMVALDGTSISVALPIIARNLHGSAIEAFWAGTSFLLTSTVFQPSFASFSHIFGRKPIVLVSIAFFLVGTLLGAEANNFTLLLLGRSLQGIGGVSISPTISS
jgi:Major Facilitator Superfamily